MFVSDLSTFTKFFPIKYNKTTYKPEKYFILEVIV